MVESGGHFHYIGGYICAAHMGRVFADFGISMGGLFANLGISMGMIFTQLGISMGTIFANSWSIVILLGFLPTFLTRMTSKRHLQVTFCRFVFLWVGFS